MIRLLAAVVRGYTGSPGMSVRFWLGQSTTRKGEAELEMQHETEWKCMKAEAEGGHMLLLAMITATGLTLVGPRFGIKIYPVRRPHTEKAR